KQEKGFPKILLTFLSKLEKRNAKKASALFTTSEYSRSVISTKYQIPKEKIFVIPEAIDLTWWNGEFSTNQGIQRKGNMILTVARQYARKRIEDLIVAMP